MGIISQSGSLNTAALAVPDLYVQIQTAGSTSLSGASTNVVGLVGTATWGPVNTPVVFGTSQERIAAFGPMQTSVFDLATVVSTAIVQGASDFVGVRVTDGTDTAASYALLYDSTAGTYPVLLSAKYSGTAGNTISLEMSAGSAPGTWKLVLQMPNALPESFDNLSVAQGNVSFWANLVSAVNNGQSATRGPSALVVASPGANSNVSPAVITGQTFMNGQDGNSGVSAQSLVGSDGVARTGMYALRGQSCSIGVLTGVTDSTTWSTQIAFGLAEGMYMIACGPLDETISDALSRRTSAGVDSYALKVMLGDWLYWYDSENSMTRLVSPQGFVAGRLSTLSPELPSLNKQLYGIIGSQKAGLTADGQTLTYSSAELTSLFQNGIDVICNPAPGGAYWCVRGGFNVSSNPEIDGDEYTRVTNFIAETISNGMGIYIGLAISPTLFSNVEATLTGFLSDLQSQGIIGSSSGSSAYSVVCSSVNNPQSRTALGYLQADISVTYLGVNRKFIVNINGGADVTVSSN
ncbi:phage tail protein [Acetobacter fallax]|uniref:Phage tail protein n=1 Tax=Acetobacter fallax TaxID=1737473 RepID=A0ABX0KFB1_9PROT|nr:phage tail protein [Acetobacter fallax]NHO34257.1 phage tail protein [Acetobacter fallax]NHO37806.1 phage tail protein [Acetobacter fallax]